MDMISFFSFALVISLFNCVTLCSGAAIPNSATDKQALLSFKNSITSDPDAILTTNWPDDTSVCNWIGVSYRGVHAGRITAVNLSGYDLAGTLPPHLGNLTFLRYLDISFNNFTGFLPFHLSNLHRLKVMNAAVNSFTGEIPRWLGSLPHLERLALNNNGFSGRIPSSLFEMSKLQVLDLSFNLLGGNIPNEIGNSSSLKSVKLSYNQLSGSIPRGMFNVSSMREIRIMNNSLSGSLPIDMCDNVPNLETLSLSTNQLSGEIPPNIWKCRHLELLELSLNHFNGKIPSEIGSLSMLRELYLGRNDFRVRFTKRKGADSPGSTQGSGLSKKLKAASQGSPVHEQQLAVTVPTVADLRPLTASPPRQREPAAVIDLAGDGGRSSGSSAPLDGFSLVEGSRRYVEWLGKEVAKLEGEKGQSAEQLKASKAKLGKANSQVKALKADLAAQVAKAAEKAVEVERLRGELEAAKGQLKATSGQLKAVTEGQGGMLRAYTKRLLLSDHFTGLAGELAGLINGNTVLDVLEEVAKDHPGLDASRYGYKRLEGAAEFTQYAQVVRAHLGRLPLLDELASSSKPLTAEMVEACFVDREADLDAAFDSLPEGDVEMEDADAGAREERAEVEPSSSRAAETGGAEEGVSAGDQPGAEAGLEPGAEEGVPAGCAVEGVSAGAQPVPEKEVGDP